MSSSAQKKVSNQPNKNNMQQSIIMHAVMAGENVAASNVVDVVTDEGSEAPLNLWDASRANPHSKFVQRLISLGADVNAKDHNEWTPLHVAAYYGQEEICEALVLAHGIDLEAKNKYGETALHLAAKWPHDKAADSLCRGGANPNACNRRGRTPLHTAALFARRTVLERLIAAGGNVNALDDELSTPLHLAIQPSNTLEVDLVTLLIKSGASVDAEDSKGRKAVGNMPQPQALLHFAATEGQLSLMKQLTACGCRLEEMNNEGLTPLHIASMRGDVEMVKLLLAHGARPNVASLKGKNNDLTVGSGPGGVKFMNKQMVGDRTALHFAAEKGATEVIQALLSSGAKVNQASECGMTALHLAVWLRHTEAVRALLQAKADVHLRVKPNYMTPLHYAAFNCLGNREIIGLLIERGADIEARTQEGWTPLHLAATAGCVEVVHELLQRGARVSAKGKKGQTPLDCARKRSEIVSLLGSASAVKANNRSRSIPALLAPPKPVPAAVVVPARERNSTRAINENATGMLSAGEAVSHSLLCTPDAVLVSTGQLGSGASTTADSKAKQIVKRKQKNPQASITVTLKTDINGGSHPAAARGSEQMFTVTTEFPDLSTDPRYSHALTEFKLGPATSSLSTLLQTLQDYNMNTKASVATKASTTATPASAAASNEHPPGLLDLRDTAGGSGQTSSSATPSQLLTPAALARLSSSNATAPQLFTQLQEALSNAMKCHNMDSSSSSSFNLTTSSSSNMKGGLTDDGFLSAASMAGSASNDLLVNTQCSLQPGRVFGTLKCLQPAAAAAAAAASGDNLKAPVIDDKLLYMYCSNNCGFQFHAACWKAAKERLKQLHPKFTGFSASRGQSSMLPCFSGDCGDDGMIDEVFMGTAHTCMELYNTKSPLQPSAPPPSQHLGGFSEVASEPVSSNSSRPWQDLLLKGDHLLKELQAQEGSWVSELEAASAGASSSSSKGVKGAGAGLQQELLARTVVSSAADMVDAISKLADVLGATSSETSVKYTLSSSGIAVKRGSTGATSASLLNASAALLPSGGKPNKCLGPSSNGTNMTAADLAVQSKLNSTTCKTITPSSSHDHCMNQEILEAVSESERESMGSAAPSLPPSNLATYEKLINRLIEAKLGIDICPKTVISAAVSPAAVDIPDCVDSLRHSESNKADDASVKVSTAHVYSGNHHTAAQTHGTTSAQSVAAAAAVNQDASSQVASNSAGKKGKKKSKSIFGGSDNGTAISARVTESMDQDLPDWLLKDIAATKAAADAAAAKGRKAKQQQIAAAAVKSVAAAAAAAAAAVTSTEGGNIVQCIEGPANNLSKVTSFESAASLASASSGVPEEEELGTVTLNNSSFAALAAVEEASIQAAAGLGKGPAMVGLKSGKDDASAKKRKSKKKTLEVPVVMAPHPAAVASAAKLAAAGHHAVTAAAATSKRQVPDPPNTLSPAISKQKSNSLPTKSKSSILPPTPPLPPPPQRKSSTSGNANTAPAAAVPPLFGHVQGTILRPSGPQGAVSPRNRTLASDALRNVDAANVISSSVTDRTVSSSLSRFHSGEERFEGVSILQPMSSDPVTAPPLGAYAVSRPPSVTPSACSPHDDTTAVLVQMNAPGMLLLPSSVALHPRQSSLVPPALELNPEPSWGSADVDSTQSLFLSPILQQQQYGPASAAAATNFLGSSFAGSSLGAVLSSSLEDQWLKPSSATPTAGHIPAWHTQTSDVVAGAMHVARHLSALPKENNYSFALQNALEQQKHLVEMLPRSLIDEEITAAGSASVLNGHAKASTLISTQEATEAYYQAAADDSVSPLQGSFLPKILDSVLEEGRHDAKRSSTMPPGTPGAADEGLDDADWVVLQQAMQAFHVDSHHPIKDALSEHERHAEGMSHSHGALSLKQQQQQQQQHGVSARLDSNDPRVLLPDSLGLDLDGGHSATSDAQMLLYQQQQMMMMMHSGQQQQQQALSQLPQLGMDVNRVNYPQKAQSLPMAPPYPQQQQQQHWGAGPQVLTHGGVAGPGLNVDVLLAGALHSMKRNPNSNQGSRHLLLESPDISLLASNPAMVEVWMKEHVGKYGSISSWRVIGPCGALAITLESEHAAAAAAAELGGKAMLVSPLAVSQLAEFPDNYVLTNYGHMVARNMSNPGSATFLEALQSCPQHIHNLPQFS